MGRQKKMRFQLFRFLLPVCLTQFIGPPGGGSQGQPDVTGTTHRNEPRGRPGAWSQKKYTERARLEILNKFIKIQLEVQVGLVQLETTNKKMTFAAKKFGLKKTPHWSNNYFIRRLELALDRHPVYAPVPPPPPSVSIKAPKWIRKKCEKLKKTKKWKRRKNGFRKFYKKYKNKCKNINITLPK